MTLNRTSASPVRETPEHIVDPESGRPGTNTSPKLPGTLTHSKMEKRLTRLLEQFYGDRRVQFGLRVTFGADIFIPDVLVLASDRPALQRDLLNELPMLCVEVLAPLQQAEAALSKCTRYREFGVPFCWVVDPVARTAWEYPAPQTGPREVAKAFSGPCQVRLRDVFAE